jgi:hypothetical protein
VSSRSSLIAFTSVAVAGLIALLIAGAGDERSTAFSLDLPDSTPVATLAAGVTACQGPVRTLVAFGGVRAWLSPTGPASLTVTVRNLRGRRLTRGVIGTDPAVAGARTSTLAATIATGTRVEMCLRNRGPGAVTLLGATATASSGRLRVGSIPSPNAFALVLLRPHPRTLLSLVPTMFARAALFKASWVGAWTFWALCAAILAAFGLTARAIAYALGEQSRSGDRRDDQ